MKSLGMFVLPERMIEVHQDMARDDMWLVLEWAAKEIRSLRRSRDYWDKILDVKQIDNEQPSFWRMLFGRSK